MRVLIISQVVLSKTNNTGKTLLSYFQGFKQNEVAQLYFHPETPTDDSICTQYYRFSDLDALKSLLNKRIKGKAFDLSMISTDKTDDKTNPKVKKKLYLVGSKHTPSALLSRDILWSLSNWRNNQLFDWIEKFNPEVIFFLSGDGGFSYKICRFISKKYSIPYISMCVDDYYINNRNRGRILSGIQHNLFMREVVAFCEEAGRILTICDKMREEYTRLFGKKCYTLHTAAPDLSIDLDLSAGSISYMGNVGYNRYKQLISMGKALTALDISDVSKTIDVYTSSIDPKAIRSIQESDGVNYCGEKTPEELLKIFSKSIAVIHTESFDEQYVELTRYSISTKIAESLMYGPCIIAYGPEGIASIDYLKENDAAYVITKEEDLESGLQEILTNESLRKRIVKNARELAKKNHDQKVNPQKVRNWLEIAAKNADGGV